MITAAFSIIRQSMTLGCFPRLRVIQTNSKIRGQIYIPEINYILMVLSIAAVGGFQTLERIGSAYGMNCPLELNFCSTSSRSKSSLSSQLSLLMQDAVGNLGQTIQMKHMSSQAASCSHREVLGSYHLKCMRMMTENHTWHSITTGNPYVLRLKQYSDLCKGGAKHIIHDALMTVK